MKPFIEKAEFLARTEFLLPKTEEDILNFAGGHTINIAYHEGCPMRNVVLWFNQDHNRKSAVLN